MKKLSDRYRIARNEYIFDYVMKYSEHTIPFNIYKMERNKGIAKLSKEFNISSTRVRDLFYKELRNFNRKNKDRQKMHMFVEEIWE